jgi:hypothetical protein
MTPMKENSRNRSATTRKPEVHQEKTARPRRPGHNDTRQGQDCHDRTDGTDSLN